MNENEIYRRTVCGKVVGLAIGVAGFFLLPFIWAGADIFTRMGFLLWYVLIGAVVGLAGAIRTIPAWNIPLNRYFRAAWIGGWFNFVLVLLAYDNVILIMEHMAVFASTRPAPVFPLVLEGVVVGIFMEWVCGRCAMTKKKKKE